MKFSKYMGCGNDFILVDNRTLFFPYYDHSLIQEICHRQTGIGGDGLILLENSLVADYKMRIFNADGSEAEMCGNGIRCLFKFIKELEIPGNQFKIDTMESLLSVCTDDHDVKVEMPLPSNLQWEISLSINNKPVQLHHLNTGVPHAINFIDSLDSVDVENQGRAIRFHPHFHPKGVNANFVSIISPNEIGIRTYERGVESETLACGTGATAAAIAAAKIKNIKSPIHVRTRSGEALKINFNSDFSEVTMTGPAKYIYTGIFKLNRRS